MTDAGVNIDEFNKWSQAQLIIKDYDMDPEVLGEAKDFVSGWIDKAGADGDGVNYEFACKGIKDAMDRQFGPFWHCIMGEGFSFEVTRQAKSTLMLYYAGKIAVLLFKC